jgi:hypothetical protein
MFGFNFKKKKSPPPPSSETTMPTIYSDVYIMPEKYIVQSAKGGNKGLIIATIILVAVILVTGGYLFYDAYSRPQQAAPTSIPTAPIVEVPAEQPSVEAPVIPEQPTTTLTPPSETPLNTPATTPATTTPSLPTTPPAISLDSDNDGLTDVEEELLGTLPTNSDTDGDGYIDGVEVANGYNPTKAGSSLLRESPFIASLTTNFASDNLQLLYPKEWQASQVVENKQVLLTAATGEVIRISIKDNEQGLSVLGWYLQEHPEAAVSQLKIVTSGNLSGIYSPDGFTVWLTDIAKTKFYVFEYLTGRQVEFRYPAIFSMIIKSLKLVTPAPPTEVIY